VKPYDPGEETSTTRRSLPHWQQQGCTYFITFRLADSIPKQKLLEWNESRLRWLKHRNLDPETPYRELLASLSPPDKYLYYQSFWKSYHDLLDNCHGDCELRDPENAKIVAKAFHHFENDRYLLGNYVIMPNHVHLLVTPLKNWELEKLTHSWKSFTAQAINKRMEQGGQLWQHESYDHIVRNDEQLERIRRYIRKNPDKLRPSEYLYHEAKM